MSELAFLKLGGSLITNKAGERAFHADRVRALAAEIVEARRERPIRLLLGHGAGCYGHVPAHDYRVREGLAGGGGWEGYAVVRRAVMELNGLVLDAMAEAGLHPAALQPSASAMARDGVLERMDMSVIEALLEQDQVPMIFGDAVLDATRGFTIISTEGFMAWLARRVRPDRIVLASDVDGVYAANPAVDPDAARLDEVGLENRDAVLGVGAGADVTGGMAGKARALMELAAELPETEMRIVGGLVPGRVRDALLGRGGGTRVVGG